MNANTISSLLWVVGAGGLFYWMMRGGGCGGHAHGGTGGHQHDDHRGHGSGNTSNTPTATSPASSHGVAASTVTDPVCRMPVHSVKPELQRSYAGQTFNFCSHDCLRKFDADPAKYATGASSTQNHSHAHAC